MIRLLRSPEQGQDWRTGDAGKVGPGANSAIGAPVRLDVKGGDSLHRPTCDIDCVGAEEWPSPEEPCTLQYRVQLTPGKYV